MGPQSAAETLDPWSPRRVWLPASLVEYRATRTLVQPRARGSYGAPMDSCHQTPSARTPYGRIVAIPLKWLLRSYEALTRRQLQRGTALRFGTSVGSDLVRYKFSGNGCETGMSESNGAPRQMIPRSVGALRLVAIHAPCRRQAGRGLGEIGVFTAESSRGAKGVDFSGRWAGRAGPRLGSPEVVEWVEPGFELVGTRPGWRPAGPGPEGAP
jgi:hypothetical protein